VVYRYKKIKEMSPEERKKVVPRVVMLGGKAFATYTQAKRIVKLVTDVGSVVNNDKDIGDLLKVREFPE
jgi:starch phosphorylase